jgi:hypothetical protein
LRIHGVNVENGNINPLISFHEPASGRLLFEEGVLRGILWGYERHSLTTTTTTTTRFLRFAPRSSDILLADYQWILEIISLLAILSSL